MACQLYFIVLTVHTRDLQNVHRLLPSVGLTQVAPIKELIMLLYSNKSMLWKARVL